MQVAVAFRIDGIFSLVGAALIGAAAHRLMAHAFIRRLERNGGEDGAPSSSPSPEAPRERPERRPEREREGASDRPEHGVSRGRGRPGASEGPVEA